MQNENNNKKKKTFLGITEGQIFPVNKSYRNFTNDYGKRHQMLISDTILDDTGTWISLGMYQISWYSPEDYSIGDKVKVVKIKHIEQNKYKSKAGVMQYIINCSVNVEKIVVNNNYSNYYQQSSNNYSQYSNNNNNNQNNNNNNNNNNSYSSYGYHNYDDNDFGL